MNLLKIGSLNLPQNRWLDALAIFDKIYVLCLEEEEELSHEKIVYLKFNSFFGFRRYLIPGLLFLIRVFNHKNEVITKSLIYFFRLIYFNYTKKIKWDDFDFIHSSYNDFDDSGLLTLLIYPNIQNKFITRAYKETRPQVNVIEKLNFEIANRIVFTTTENKIYFKRKYNHVDWKEKEIITDLDEDYRSQKTISKIIHDKKLSSVDGLIHLVILSGRVLSDDLDERSGGRLNYIPLIKYFLKNGFVVHLHTKKIIFDCNGVDQYGKLKIQYPNLFFIETPLNFEEHPTESYKTLSRYDFGILHNVKENEPVSEFDKINIPHRFYEYQLAGVIPIVHKGDTIVMERIFREYNYGYVYENIEELNNVDMTKFDFLKRTFSEYINFLYG